MLAAAFFGARLRLSLIHIFVWPSSEGDAAFVRAVPADSEDGDLAVYKIDACLIGDDEITICL